MNLPDFRTRLQDIICTEDFDGHPSAIENLKSEFPHTIQLAELTTPTLPRNCYEWALGLVPELTHWVGGFDLPELYAGPKSISGLARYLTEIPMADVTDGDLTLYFEGQLPSHGHSDMECETFCPFGN